MIEKDKVNQEIEALNKFGNAKKGATTLGLPKVTYKLFTTIEKTGSLALISLLIIVPFLVFKISSFLGETLALFLMAFSGLFLSLLTFWWWRDKTQEFRIYLLSLIRKLLNENLDDENLKNKLVG